MLDGRVTTYNRDANGLLQSKVLPNGDTYTYDRYEDTQEGTSTTRITAPDGTYTAITYLTLGAARGRIKRIERYDAGDTLLSQYVYTYDGFGRVTNAIANGH